MTSMVDWNRGVTNNRILLFAIVCSSTFNVIISRSTLLCTWQYTCSTHGIVYQGLG